MLNEFDPRVEIRRGSVRVFFIYAKAFSFPNFISPYVISPASLPLACLFLALARFLCSGMPPLAITDRSADDLVSRWALAAGRFDRHQSPLRSLSPVASSILLAHEGTLPPFPLCHRPPIAHQPLHCNGTDLPSPPPDPFCATDGQKGSKPHLVLLPCFPFPSPVSDFISSSPVAAAAPSPQDSTTVRRLLSLANLYSRQSHHQPSFSLPISLIDKS